MIHPKFWDPYKKSWNTAKCSGTAQNFLELVDGRNYEKLKIQR